MGRKIVPHGRGSESLWWTYFLIYLLYDLCLVLLGQHDFWVTTPCQSSAYQARVLEGTRLTVVVSLFSSLSY